MPHKRIRRIAVVFLLVVAAVVLLVFSRKTKAPVAAPRSAAVVAVSRGPIASSLTVAGQFQAYQEVDLQAKVSGYIRWIKVDIGDRVHEGEVLADLEMPDLQDELQGSEAMVRHTQSEIIY